MPSSKLWRSLVAFWGTRLSRRQFLLNIHRPPSLQGSIGTLITLLEVSRLPLSSQSQLHLGSFQQRRGLTTGSLLPKREKGKRFDWRFHGVCSLAGGRCLRAILGTAQSRVLDGGGASLQVLRSFPSLPPVMQEPIEFPSYGLGSIKGHSIQKEVDKILGKGTLEEVNSPGLGFCSRLFLVQKVLGGWRLLIYVSFLNNFITVIKLIGIRSHRKGSITFSIGFKDSAFKSQSFWNLDLL